MHGAEILAHVSLDAPTVDWRPAGLDEADATTGAAVVARLSPRSDAAPERSLGLAVDPAGLRLFDPESGAALLGGPHS